MLAQDGPRYVRELIEWGAAFDRDGNGQPALGREAAHSVRRVLHARDATGREIGRVLWQKVAAASSRDCVRRRAGDVARRPRRGLCRGEVHRS